MAFDHDKNRPVHRLVDAVREVKIAAAERNDVVVEMKEADRARLEILAAELQPVFDEVPLDDERFDFAISSGLQPRLWIDATAHVMMGKDRRVYRFVRDTRLGRITLAEGRETGPIAKAVTRYIAERMHEREMALAGDEMVFRAGPAQRRSDVSYMSEEEAAPEFRPAPRPHPVSRAYEAAPAKASPMRQPVTEEVPERSRVSTTSASWIGWLLVGLFVGGGSIIIAFRDQLLP